MVRRLLDDAGERGGRKAVPDPALGGQRQELLDRSCSPHQMIPLLNDGRPVFDSIIVVTDRRILDRQIRDTIRPVRPGGIDRRARRKTRAI